MRTTFPTENVDSGQSPKDSPNIPGALGGENEKDVKFPKRLRYRGKGKVLATIYKRQDCYRLYWRAQGGRQATSRFKDFPTYSAARQAGDKVGRGPGQGRPGGAALARAGHRRPGRA